MPAGAVAREAGRRGVPIYTVALGTETAVVRGPDGSALPVPPDPQAHSRCAGPGACHETVTGGA